LVSLRPAKVVFWLRADVDGERAARYGIALHDLQGRCLTRIFAPVDRFALRAGEYRRVEVVFNPLQIGPGTYTLGVSVTRGSTIEQINAAAGVDLLSRSFVVNVVLPDSMGALSADFFQSAEWRFDNATPGTADPVLAIGARDAAHDAQS